MSYEPLTLDQALEIEWLWNGTTEAARDRAMEDPNWPEFKAELEKALGREFGGCS